MAEGGGGNGYDNTHRESVGLKVDEVTDKLKQTR